ncbi:hypothetical protein SBOR_4401 [Sclerotinia borealis F-4128]|uniref:J domain-containing protein n=1 Tax=Sclerotinia borealis (strain F-4128) TaxID=1432307 RepID=W9CEM4_SCLBF|nr:hypothetical protein SBOR_4401 [Sclerotinia borealis F-4128]
MSSFSKSRSRQQTQTPPTTPSTSTTQIPRPLPFPTEKSQYKSWVSARSSSPVISNAPSTPSTPLRSVSYPTHATLNANGNNNISHRFANYDQISSSTPEIGAQPIVEEKVEKVEMSNPYTMSYYEILGLPESADVTTKDIDEAYRKILANNNTPSTHPTHDPATLQRIQKTLTNALRRRAYDLGRRAHLLLRTHAQDRETFERGRTGEYVHSESRSESHSDTDFQSDYRHVNSVTAKRFVDNLRTENLKNEMEGVKRDFEEKIGNMGIGMGMGMGIGIGIGMDGCNEEGVAYEEMLYGAKGSEPRGERLSLDFEFNGSGSDVESGSEEEGESGGTFSEREEEREKFDILQWRREREREMEMENLLRLAAAVPLPESASFDTEIEAETERAVEDMAIPMNIPESPSKIHLEAIFQMQMQMYTEEDLSIINFLFPNTTPCPISCPTLTTKSKSKSKSKSNSASCKEIWEIDYESSCDCDSDTDIDAETPTQDTNPSTSISINHNPEPSSSSLFSEYNPDATSENCVLEEEEKEIWEFDYTPFSSSSSLDTNSETCETIHLATTLTASIFFVSALWVWVWCACAV